MSVQTPASRRTELNGLMTDRASQLKAHPPGRRIAEMHTDISMLLIDKLAGFGLAPRKWRAALKQIRELPEVRAN
jgi:hypothetical protein